MRVSAADLRKKGEALQTIGADPNVQPRMLQADQAADRPMIPLYDVQGPGAQRIQRSFQ